MNTGFEINMHPTLEHIIEKLGFENVEVFVQQRLTEMLVQKISKYEAQVKVFEQKYNMDFETFEKTYINPDVEEDFEKWDDNMIWDFAQHALANARQLLQLLEKEGLTLYNRPSKVEQKAQAYYKKIEQQQ